jgi:hypothetical protein
MDPLILTTYDFLSIMWLWYHLDNYRDTKNTDGERKACLRFAWLAPIWPLVLVWVYVSKLWRVLRDTFKEAWL